MTGLRVGFPVGETDGDFVGLFVGGKVGLLVGAFTKIPRDQINIRCNENNSAIGGVA